MRTGVLQPAAGATNRRYHIKNEHYWFTITTSGTADPAFGTYPDPATAGLDIPYSDLVPARLGGNDGAGFPCQRFFDPAQRRDHREPAS